MTTKGQTESGYDALLFVSFGGPEGMDDVMPFLENVLRGRNVPRERMMQVASHYNQLGGVSPMNEQNRKLISALEKELETNGPRLPIYWGNRNWHPLLPDAVQKMADDGRKKALAFVTSAYSSYSSCRQYLQNIADARAAVGEEAPEIHKLRAFYNHPLFIEANVDHVRAALNRLEPTSDSLHLVFTAHSIPESMAENCEYANQLREASRLVASAVGIDNWELVYQSRSGRPGDPWLEPDVSDYLRRERAAGLQAAVICPIGFVCDHIEVLYDLDREAAGMCREIGLPMARAEAVNDDPLFLDMMADVVLRTITKYEHGRPLPLAAASSRP